MRAPLDRSAPELRRGRLQRPARSWRTGSASGPLPRRRISGSTAPNRPVSGSGGGLPNRRKRPIRVRRRPPSRISVPRASARSPAPASPSMAAMSSSVNGRCAGTPQSPFIPSSWAAANLAAGAPRLRLTPDVSAYVRRKPQCCRSRGFRGNHARPALVSKLPLVVPSTRCGWWAQSTKPGCGRHTEWAFGGRSVPGKSSASLHPQQVHTHALLCVTPHPPPAGRRRDAPSVANSSRPARTGGPTAARESAAVRPATCGRHTEWAFGGRSVPGKSSASFGLRPASHGRPRAAIERSGCYSRRWARGGAVTQGGTANIAGDGFATLAARGRARAHLLALRHPLRTLAGLAAAGHRDRMVIFLAVRSAIIGRSGRTPGLRSSRGRWRPPGPRCWSGGSPASAGDNLRAARAGSARQPGVNMVLFAVLRRAPRLLATASLLVVVIGAVGLLGLTAAAGIDLPAAARAARPRRFRPARRGRCRC